MKITEKLQPLFLITTPFYMTYVGKVKQVKKR